MKKPERLLGFVKYEDIDFPFEFDEATGDLKLFPPTREVLNQYSNISSYIKEFNEPKNHRWIELSQINGITSEHNKVIFCVKELRSIYNGFISLHVVWYLYYNNQLNTDEIDGLMVGEYDMNLFYPPESALTCKSIYDKEDRSFLELSVTAQKPKIVNCGEFEIKSNVKVEVNVVAYTTSRFSSTPIDVNSYMILRFSEHTNLERVVELYNCIVNFLKFVTYRENIVLSDVQLYKKTDKGPEYCGLLVFTKKMDFEISEKAKKKVINYKLLKNKVASIFSLIAEEKINFRHLCKSVQDTNIYHLSRIIMILAEFEKVYKDIYGTNANRSKEYSEVKIEAIAVLDQFKSTKTGTQRDHAKELVKFLRRLDDSYSDRIQYAVSDCRSIMEPFIIHNYKNMSYEATVAAMRVRLNDLRNEIAHNNMDIEFEAVHLADVKIVEQLIYAIRLKQIGLNDIDCKRAINCLFDEKLAL